MKKYCIYLLGLLAVLATSCTVEQPAEVILSGDGYTAVIEAPAATRTVADENLHVLWSKGDQLSIFDQSTWNGQYELKGEGGTNTGEFRKIERTDYHAGMELPYVYAVYPYNEANNVTNDGVISVTLPAAQTYAPNSFGLGDATMASIAVGKELKFKNLCGFFAVSLYGTAKVKTITLKGNNNEPIAGAATITAPEEGVIPVLAMASTATKEITLTCTEPVQLGNSAETATIFWIAVPPTTFTQGVTVTVTNDKGESFEKKTTGALEIVRNTKKETEPLKAFEETGTPMFMMYPFMTLLVGGKAGTQKVYYGSVDNYRAAEEAEDITWSSNDPAVATVGESNGTVKAVAPGQTTVIGTNEKGETISFIVTVLAKPEKNYADYVRGVSLFDCRDASLPWNKKFTEYALTDGYLEGTKCMGAHISAYKIAELYFPTKVDASQVQNPALFIRMYISDPSKLCTVSSNDTPYIEIRSTGKVWKPDVTDFNSIYQEEPKTFWAMSEIFSNWQNAAATAKQTLVAGWNNIVLPVSKATRQACDLSAITYFRIWQLNGQTYNDVEFRFDEIRIIDWTELDSCDNFTMWFDGMAGENCPAYVNDNTGTVGVGDYLVTGNNDSFRLKMWPGLEYAIPAVFDINDLKLQYKFKCDDPAFFDGHVHFRVELGSNANYGVDVESINVTGGYGTPRPLNLQEGWNTLSFNFSDAALNAGFDPRKIKLVRVIFNPDWTIDSPTPLVGYHNYRIDDLRIVEK